MLSTNPVFYFKSLFFVLLAALALPACQPEIDGDIPPPSTNTKPKTYSEILLDGTDTLSAETFNIFYTSDGKLASLVSAGNPGNKFVYTYSASGFIMDLYQSNQVTLSAKYFLNSAGLVDTSVQYNVGATDTSTEKYTYTSANRLTSIRRYGNSGNGYVLEEEVRLDYDASGNVIKETSTIDGVTTYTHYADLRNTFQIFPQSAINSPFLVKTTTTSSYSLSHTYTFDQQQRLVQETAVESSGLTLHRKITY